MSQRTEDGTPVCRVNVVSLQRLFGSLAKNDNDVCESSINETRSEGNESM